MSKATKCDRCGGYFEQGGKAIRQGFGANMAEFDLCADCAEAFDAWIEYQPVTDAPERVTNQAEMLHDTREKLEADVRCLLMMFSGHCRSRAQDGEFDVDERLGTVNSWFGSFVNALDRQAAITEREFFETACQGCERLGGDDDDTLGELKAERDELAQRIQMLEREIATLKEHRAGNMERLHELTDECAELRKYRDEWKGLAEKYRADSIAAQEESERYRAKLGDVLDAIHEAERAAR